VAAIVTTFHDVAITIAMYGLFSLTVNNPFIAAILTVVGYSINDTIVIFDRIRENLTTLRRRKLATIVDVSVNQTLVRSLMTALTTILAILPLIFIGGESIQQFAIPLVIGIATGACSSIFIASPLYYDLAKKEFQGVHGRYKGAEKQGVVVDTGNPIARLFRTPEMGEETLADLRLALGEAAAADGADDADDDSDGGGAGGAGGDGAPKKSAFGAAGQTGAPKKRKPKQSKKQRKNNGAVV